LLAIASLPEYLEVNTRRIYSSCRAAYSSMSDPIFSNKRVDKILLTSLKRNSAIPTPRPREYVNFMDIRRKAAEGLIHTNARLAA